MKNFKHMAKLREFYSEYPFATIWISLLIFYYNCFITCIHPSIHSESCIFGSRSYKSRNKSEPAQDWKGWWLGASWAMEAHGPGSHSAWEVETPERGVARRCAGEVASQAPRYSSGIQTGQIYIPGTVVAPTLVIVILNRGLWAFADLEVLCQIPGGHLNNFQEGREKSLKTKVV